MKYVLGVLFLLFFLVRVISVVARSRSDVTSPGGVAQRLTATGRHVVSVAAHRYVWNPSLPVGPKNRVEGPGTATYTYAAGVVTLDYAPRSGEARRYTGGLPEGLHQPDTTPSLGADIAAPVVGLATAIIALLIEGGPLSDHITLVSLWGITGWIVASIVMMTTNQVIRTRAFAANRAH
jgi:hypothetical protein